MEKKCAFIIRDEILSMKDSCFSFDTDNIISLIRGCDNLCIDNDWSLLTCAAAWGQIPIIKELVANGVNVNGVDCLHNNSPALHMALHYSQLEAASTLIDLGADIEFRDENGKTPLLNYVSKRYDENFREVPISKSVLRFLFERNADIKAVNSKTNENIYDIASKKDIDKILSVERGVLDRQKIRDIYYLPKCICYRKSDVYEAIFRKDYDEMCSELITLKDDGADFNALYVTEYDIYRIFFVLMNNALDAPEFPERFKDRLKYLISLDVLNYEFNNESFLFSNSGYNLLYLPDIAKMMLDRGADPKLRSDDGAGAAIKSIYDVAKSESREFPELLNIIEAYI